MLSLGFSQRGCSMTNLSLEKLLKQKEQLEARIKMMQTRTQLQSRKDETRRKILAGAYVLKKYESENKGDEFIQELDQFLFKAGDRILFGLPPRAEDASPKPREGSR